MSNIPEVIIYTDGACVNNPGTGGYGVVLIFGKHRKELSAGYKKTTNNRMEKMGVIVGLQTLKTRCKVKLYSDSKYVVETLQKGWIKNWKDNAWRNRKGEKILNTDLWEKILQMTQEHEVEFIWVKGHDGIIENERCDELAETAARQEDLQEDEGYEQSNEDKKQKSTKIVSEGQPCRKCLAPVIKKYPKIKPKPHQEYYFEYYLFCPKCHTTYFNNEAKRYY